MSLGWFSVPSVHSSWPSRVKRAHRVIGVVGAVDDVVVDGDAVRAGEDALAPGPQKLPVAVVDDDRVLAAVEDEDAVLRIGGDPGHVAVGPARGQLLPVREPAQKSAYSRRPASLSLLCFCSCQWCCVRSTRREQLLTGPSAAPSETTRSGRMVPRDPDLRRGYQDVAMPMFQNGSKDR